MADSSSGGSNNAAIVGIVAVVIIVAVLAVLYMNGTFTAGGGDRVNVDIERRNTTVEMPEVPDVEVPDVEVPTPQDGN